MNQLVVVANDDYFFMLKWCLASFFTYHRRNDWNVIFLDVGCSPSTRSILERIGQCVSYPPHRAANSQGLVFPAAFARLASLSEHVPDQGIYLYVDTDSLFFASLDPLIRQFRQSGIPLAIAVEDDPGFRLAPMWESWIGEIPREFIGQHRWRDLPILNTGMLLAQGSQLRPLADFAQRLYALYRDRLQYAEQSLLASLIYEWEVPYLNIPHHVHCFAREQYVSQDRPGRRYVDAAPVYNGHLVTMRHFCANSKGVLGRLRPQLDEKYEHRFSRLQVESLPKQHKRDHCLVPSGHQE